MDQKPERSYSRIAVGGALGAVIGLLMSLALDSLWWLLLGSAIGPAIGAGWERLRTGKDGPSER
jgi:hypothetical protein